MTPVLKLDLLQTLTLAAVVYFLGLVLRRRIGILDRLNIPSAVVGGLLFAVLVLVTRDRVVNFEFDRAMEPVLNVAFFTTIGMGASLAVLRDGVLLALQPGMVPAAGLDELVKQVRALDMAEVQKSIAAAQRLTSGSANAGGA